MKDILQTFRYEPDGARSLEDALCAFIKEEIAFGRLKGGDRLPTMRDIAQATGLTFGKARLVVERLSREGYVHSRPYAGTVVLPRGANVLRGRVLVALPDVDAARFFSARLIDILHRRLSTAGYAFAIVTFPLEGGGGLADLQLELLRPDLVIAVRATPQVQKSLAASNIRRLYLFTAGREDPAAPRIRVSSGALDQFAEHCARARVKNVVQVRFAGDDTFDARPALARKGISCTWLDMPHDAACGWGIEGDTRRAYETFAAMPPNRFPDLLLFWNAFLAQGAGMAFLTRGIRLPEDVKVVALSNAGLGPVYPKSITRFEIDPLDNGEKVASYALSILAKGRLPRPPVIIPKYIFGATFPF
jgi:DNA-binding LacI/PurR family transcriptional regulator